MKINLDSPVIVFNYSCRFMILNILFIYAVRRSLRSARQSVPFTRLCARQDMRVDIYSNLFQSI